MVEKAFVVGLLSSTVAAATPLLLATLGEIICERSGNLNLGVEGMMLVGALTGFVAALWTGNPYVGFLVGTLSGVGMALLHAILTIELKANQVISGIMITLLGTAMTTFFGNAIDTKSIDGFSEVTIPVVGDALLQIPILGPVFFRAHMPDFLALALVPAVWYFLNRTQFGLAVVAAGEDPETADTMGIPVKFVRYAAVLIGGGFAGAAGADLSLAYANIWGAQMTDGRGWIAVALVIFASWQPLRALIGAYFFGFIDALALRSQTLISELSGTGLDSVVEFALDPSIMTMYPYLLTIIALIVISREASAKELGAPSALKEPYVREAE